MDKIRKGSLNKKGNRKRIRLPFLSNFQLSLLNFLKFLSDNEVEVAATSLRTSVRTIETVSPVDTHQTDHREEDTDTDTGRTLQLERIEILQISPGITRFYEYQTVDR